MIAAQYVPVIQELIRKHWPLEHCDSEFITKPRKSVQLKHKNFFESLRTRGLVAD